MFKQIDRLLHFDFQGTDSEKDSEFSVKSLLQIIFLLGLIYGVFMGLYSLVRGTNANGVQIPVSAVKVPLLFLLTLVVTVPSLYVFSTLAGARIDVRRLLNLVLTGTAMTMAVLASLGPITAFFTLCTESYGFMVILNVVFFAISGAIGLKFLTKSMTILISGRSPKPTTAVAADREEPEPEAAALGAEAQVVAPVPLGPPAPTTSSSPTSPTATAPQFRPQPKKPADPTTTILKIWVLMYLCVGTQMSWIMRPFIGDPKHPFVLFRGIDSNFFAAVLNVFVGLFK